MKKNKLLAISLITFSSMVFAPMVKAQKIDPLTKLSDKIINITDTLSYALGQNYAQTLRNYLESEGVLIKNPKKDPKISQENEAILQMFDKGIRNSIGTLSPKERAYVLGNAIGTKLNKVVEDFDEEVMPEGLTVNKILLANSMMERIKGYSPAIPNSQSYIDKASNAKRDIVTKNRAEKQKALEAQKILDEQEFFAENLKVQGVRQLPSGLQYRVLQYGTGEKPTRQDKVTVHYEGRLLDGTVFDSSISRGEPTTFPVGAVIKGWTEILQEMPVGSKWEVFIPQELAYGSRDTGTIPPFSTLVFIIELLSIN